jgi:hypothetical protein
VEKKEVTVCSGVKKEVTQFVAEQESNSIYNGVQKVTVNL